MSNAFSRRDFLKASAAAVLALSVSGALTGCGEQETIYETTLGDFKVRAYKATVANNSVVGDDAKSSIKVTMNVSLTYTGSGLNVDTLGNVFSMELADDSLEDRVLKQTSNGVIAGANIPTMNSAKNYTLNFETKNAEQYKSYNNGRNLRLKVKLFSQTAIFNLAADGSILSIGRA